MKRIYLLVFGVLILGLLGCADSHQLTRLNGNDSQKLNINNAVYISMPKNGYYGNKNYRHSGLNTANILQSSFVRHIRNTTIGRHYENYNTSLKSANKNNADYLIFSTILHWEDRATEWSSIPDKVELKIEVISVNDGKTISSGIIKGKSGIATFGGDHPQDLLIEPINQFVSSLYFP